MFVDGADSGDMTNAPIHGTKMMDHTRRDDCDGCTRIDQRKSLNLTRRRLQPLRQPFHGVGRKTDPDRDKKPVPFLNPIPHSLTSNGLKGRGDAMNPLAW